MGGAGGKPPARAASSAMAGGGGGAAVELPKRGLEINISTLGKVCSCPEDLAKLCETPYTVAFRVTKEKVTEEKVTKFTRLACKGRTAKNTAAKEAADAEAKDKGVPPRWTPPLYKPVTTEDVTREEVRGTKVVITEPGCLFYDCSPATTAALLDRLRKEGMSGAKKLIETLRVDTDGLFAKYPKSQEAFTRALAAVPPVCEPAKKCGGRCVVECKNCDFYPPGQWATRAGKEGADPKDVKSVLSILNKPH